MPLKPHPTDPDKIIYVKREYTPPKEWVGLTAEETNDLIQKWAGELVFEVTQALKDKNGY